MDQCWCFVCTYLHLQSITVSISISFETKQMLTRNPQIKQRCLPPNLRQVSRHVRPQGPIHPRHGRIHTRGPNSRLRQQRHLHGRLFRDRRPVLCSRRPSRCRNLRHRLREAIQAQKPRICMFQCGESSRVRGRDDHLGHRLV